MKRLLSILLFVTSSAFAGPNGYHGSALHGPHQHYHGGGGGWGWVVPAVIGGTIVYAATRPPVVVQQQPVIVQQPPAEIVYIDGIAYRKQVMVINGQAQEVLVRL